MDLEGAWKKLLQLVADGVPYEFAEMLAELAEIQTMDAQWKSLEREHLALGDTYTVMAELGFYVSAYLLLFSPA